MGKLKIYRNIKTFRVSDNFYRLISITVNYKDTRFTLFRIQYNISKDKYIRIIKLEVLKAIIKNAKQINKQWEAK